MNETLGNGLQLFPTGANLLRLLGADRVIGGGGGDDRQQIGKLLDDLVGGWDEVIRMRVMPLGVADEEPARALANPLHDAGIIRAANQSVDAIQWVDGAAARPFLGRFGPLVDHGEGQAQLRRDLLGAALLKDFAQQFVGVHAR